MNWNEDGKLEVNGLTFHKQHWHEKPKVTDNPVNGVNWANKKDELANKAKRYFIDYKYPNMEEHKQNLNYDQERELSVNFLKEMGFVSKEISRWPYHSWTHPLKVADLKDLIIETFKEEMAEETKKYEESRELCNQYQEDMKNREILAEGIEDYIKFKSCFNVRQTAMRELIENVELSIGKGHYRRLAHEKDGYGNYRYIPEENRVNAFESMHYAKEWLLVFDPIIDELDRLDDVLNFPWRLSGEYNGITEESLRKINLGDLANFRYQDFLTFLMDFKLRFGDKRRGDYDRDSKILSGWTIKNHDKNGKYRSGGDAAEWDVFNCEADVKIAWYGMTWGEWLENKALNGEIVALSDPLTLEGIVGRTNHSRHRHNQEYKLYRKPMILVTKSEPKEEAEE